jgi:hypothetical protein
MFPRPTEPKLRAAVEQATGRRVIGFMSGIDVARDLANEVFTLEPRPDANASVAATMALASDYPYVLVDLTPCTFVDSLTGGAILKGVSSARGLGQLELITGPASPRRRLEWNCGAGAAGTTGGWPGDERSGR